LVNLVNWPFVNLVNWPGVPVAGWFLVLDPDPSRSWTAHYGWPALRGGKACYGLHPEGAETPGLLLDVSAAQWHDQKPLGFGL